VFGKPSPPGGTLKYSSPSRLLLVFGHLRLSQQILLNRLADAYKNLSRLSADVQLQEVTLIMHTMDVISAKEVQHLTAHR
jgi:hypothetical protein